MLFLNDFSNINISDWLKSTIVAVSNNRTQLQLLSRDQLYVTRAQTFLDNTLDTTMPRYEHQYLSPLFFGLYAEEIWYQWKAKIESQRTAI